MSVLAIDIGGTKFTIARFEKPGSEWRMSHRASRATDRTGGPQWMTERIREIASEWNADFDRIGVGFGGPVDFATQKVVLSTHVGGWEGFDLVEWLRRELRVPVCMDNDANVGALGEGLFGAGRGFRPLFYMTLSTGIGGAIVSNGQLMTGPDGVAGELGHLTIDMNGPICGCGGRGHSSLRRQSHQPRQVLGQTS